jgi:hypothetical protein
MNVKLQLREKHGALLEHHLSFLCCSTLAAGSSTQKHYITDSSCHLNVPTKSAKYINLCGGIKIFYILNTLFVLEETTDRGEASCQC